MEIVLVRHGQPEWVNNGLNVDDPPLTRLGHEQSVHIADRLATEHFDEILVSPLLRARQTAAPLLERLGRKMEIEPWLEEIRSPIWQDTPEEKAVEAWKAHRSKNSTERWSGLDDGEAVIDFVNRINVGASLFLEERGLLRQNVDLPVWEKAAGRGADSKILLVCHAGTSSVVICHLLGLSPTPWEWERFVVGHASISRIHSFELGDGFTFSLNRLAEDAHLPDSHRSF